MAAGIPPPDDPTPESVADLLHATTRRLRHAARDDLQPEGITPAQWRALRAVAHHDHPLRMSGLADRLGIARRSATDVVHALVTLGLADRVPDPGDRRSVCVTLTTQGRAVVAEVRARRRQSTAQALHQLSGDELATLRDLLQRIGDGAGAAGSAG